VSKNPEWRARLKKDPGIPNLFPYKEKLLHQIEENKRRKAEEIARKRQLAKGVTNGTVFEDASLENVDNEEASIESGDLLSDDEMEDVGSSQSFLDTRF
jgi:nuclear GTP-binding protein